MSERINLNQLRDEANAWTAEITEPGNYGTDAYHALMDDLFYSGPDKLLALIDAVQAAHDLHPEAIGDGWRRCDDPDCDECVLREKLDRFDYEDQQRPTDRAVQPPTSSSIRPSNE